ncbi:MAG TPA: ATP-binding protein [Longimicrobium sp.]|nr:ATP-binding protein [Longimicrobium sp.]
MKERPGAAPAEPTAFALELPSDLRLIDTAIAYLVTRCREYHFGGSRLTLNFRVGVAEALANAMIYGNGSDPSKRVRVEVELDPERINIRVVDEGKGFDPTDVPDPTLPEHLEATGGRGLFLIRSLMDEVDFNECGNCIRLTLYREKQQRPLAS